MDSNRSNDRKVTTRSRRARTGAAMMEVAMVSPLFFLFVFGVFEFGHAYLTINLLDAAAAKAARHGVTEGVTTAEVTSIAQTVVAAALPTASVSVYVKDASEFDTVADFDSTTIQMDEMTDLELSGAQSRQLFLVRLEVDYDDIGFFGPEWLTDLTLRGQAVMRHE